MTKRTRATAFLLALAVWFVMLISALYLAANVSHSCMGEGCPVCAQTEACEHTLYGISLSAVFASVAAFMPILCAGSVKFYSLFFFSDTPVSLKVKLSN